MKRLVLLLLAAAASLPLAAASDISIPELLNPEMRMRAFHEFMRKANTEDISGNAEEFDKFAESYEILSLSTLQSAEQGRRYLLVWDWKAANEDAWSDPPLNDDRRLIPRKSYYQVFDESGSRAGDSGIIWNGAVADPNGDGNLDEIVWESSTSPIIPGLNSAASDNDPGAEKRRSSSTTSLSSPSIARVLIAFAAANAPEFEIGRESATERLQAHLAKIWSGLSAAEQKELRDFTSWCEEHALTKLPGTIEASQLALVIESARSALK